MGPSPVARACTRNRAGRIGHMLTAAGQEYPRGFLDLCPVRYICHSAEFRAIAHADYS
jgi:hypothetical protein